MSCLGSLKPIGQITSSVYKHNKKTEEIRY